MITKLDIVLRTTLIALIAAPYLFMVSAVAIVQRAFGQTGIKTQWAYLSFSKLVLAVVGVRLHVNGPRPKPGQDFVVVSNHESNLDPFVIMVALNPLAIRFVIKRQLMKIPIFGHALRWTGNVSVDRSAGGADVRRLQETTSSREAGISLLFFAEGTRSRDGSFQPFKKGAFATAIGMHLPVLPVAIAGAYRVFPPGGFALRSGTVTIEIGDAVPTTGFAITDRNTLHAEVHERVGELRATARAHLRQLGVEPGGVD